MLEECLCLVQFNSAHCPFHAAWKQLLRTAEKGFFPCQAAKKKLRGRLVWRSPYPYVFARGWLRQTRGRPGYEAIVNLVLLNNGSDFVEVFLGEDENFVCMYSSMT